MCRHRGTCEGVAIERTRVRIDRILGNLLNLDHVPADADLLDLGGDSLTAEWIAARLRDEFGDPTLTGRDVLVHTPTVARLAARMGPLATPIPLSSQQEALLGRMRQAQRDGLPTRAFNAATATALHGRLNIPALRDALESLVHHQAALRTSYTVDQTWHVRLNPAEPLALPVIDLNRDEILRHVVSTTNTPFRFDDPVRLRPQLLRTDAEEHVLVLTMDHIVGDGLSLAVLHNELARRYAGQPLDHQPTHAFFDFLAAQRVTEPAEALAYWRETLGDDGVLAHVPLPFERNLPMDSPRVARTISRTVGATQFHYMLTALAVVLRDITGMDRPTILCPDANRTPGTRSAIGWFSHLVPYRVDLSGDPPPAEALIRVRHTVAQAQAHKHITYHDLIKALRPDRFGVIRDATWVNLVAVEPAPLELPGLRCHPITIPADAPYRALEIEHETPHLRLNFDANRFPEPDVTNLLDRLIGTLHHLEGR